MFNVRAYGILINKYNQVLVCDELIKGMAITKFCGGGLEFGEGLIDCIKREFLEEMNLAIEVSQHFYTTDFYQQSAFNSEHQVISVYYLVEANEEFKLQEFTNDKDQLCYFLNDENEIFRFIDMADFSEDSVTLPIDKIVAGMVKKQLSKPKFFTEPLLLENERARLEPLEEKHFDILLPIAMQKELWSLASVKVNTEMDFRRYFDEAITERSQYTSYPFAVFDKKFNRYAGSTRYGNISFPNKRLEIGWTWYDKELQGTGLNKACKNLLLSYGFEILELNRIEQKTSLLNERSQAAMTKLGATREGVFRRHMVNDDGTIRDSVYFSYIRDEWEVVKNKIGFSGAKH